MSITATMALWRQWRNGGEAAKKWLDKMGDAPAWLTRAAGRGGTFSGLASRGASALGAMGKLNKAMVPLAVADGLKQAIKPDHEGGRGLADRIAGGAQAAGGVAALGGLEAATGLGVGAGVAASVPVVGWAVLGATGAYFAGSYVYDKWGDDIAAGAKTAWNTTSNAVGNAVDSTVDTTVDAALHPSRAVKTAEHAVNGTVDSVKKLKFW